MNQYLIFLCLIIHFEPKTELDTIPRTLFFTKLEALRNKTPENKEVVTETNQNNTLPDNKDEIQIFTGDVVETDSSSQGVGKDFSNFVFGKQDSSQERVYANDSLFIPKDNLDNDGNYQC